jgi:hypothetical protein
MRLEVTLVGLGLACSEIPLLCFSAVPNGSQRVEDKISDTRSSSIQAVKWMTAHKVPETFESYYILL